jgi:hypothetical protein
MMKTILLYSLSIGTLSTSSKIEEFLMMTNDDLFTKIEHLRKTMISVGLSKGFTSVETVKLSEKLDKLINLQMGLLEKISA